MKFVLTNTANGAQKKLNGKQTIPVLNGQAFDHRAEDRHRLFRHLRGGRTRFRRALTPRRSSPRRSRATTARTRPSTRDRTGRHGRATPTSWWCRSTGLPTSGVPPGDLLLRHRRSSKNIGTDAAPASTTSFYLVNTSTAAKKNLKGGQNVGRPGLRTLRDGPTAIRSLVYSDTLPGTYRHAGLRRWAEGPSPKAVETNNCTDAAGTVTVFEVPNLVVSSIGNPPAAAPLGGVIKLTSSGRKTLGNVQGRRLDHQVLPDPEGDGSPRKKLKGGTGTFPR